MECPYCASSIADRALVCPTCTRDLYLFKPLLARQAELEAKVAAQAREIAALAEKFGAAESRLAAALPQGEPGRAEPPAAGRRFLWGAIRNVALAFMVLQGASWYARVIYHATDAQLSVFTVVVSLPFGYLLLRRYPASLRRCILPSVAMGIVSVACWRVISAQVEGTPLWPRSIVEWRIPLEFVAGIGLGYFTGALLRHAQRVFAQGGRRQPPQIMRNVAAFFGAGAGGETGIDALARTIQRLVAVITPTATGMTAIYTIFKAFAGT